MYNFEWDDAKDQRNRAKHGIPFVDAAQIFYDPDCFYEEDRVVDGEQRWHATGMLEAAVLLVVFCYRETTNENETIRIISAREASKIQRRRYQEQAYRF